MECVRVLVKYGASMNCTSKNSWTPLKIAAFMGKLEVCEFLLHHEKDESIQ